MFVEMTMVLDVEKQDSSKDAIESAQNQLRSMDLEEMIDLFTYTVNP